MECMFCHAPTDERNSGCERCGLEIQSSCSACGRLTSIIELQCVHCGTARTAEESIDATRRLTRKRPDPIPADRDRISVRLGATVLTVLAALTGTAFFLVLIIQIEGNASFSTIAMTLWTGIVYTALCLALAGALRLLDRVAEAVGARTKSRQ